MKIIEGIKVKIELYKNESTMKTSRVSKYNFLTIILTMIGSIFGFMEVFAACMATTEKTIENINTKFQKLGAFKKIVDGRISISQTIKINFLSL